jgi:hypothetical protein
MGERLDSLARRVGEDRFFLASALADYARGNGLDDAGLAQLLGCDAATLVRLRLCRRPDGGAAAFREDVARIADRFWIDGEVLAQIVRWADAVEGLRAVSDADEGQIGRGALLAARDREAGDVDPPDDAEGGRS